MKRITYLAQIQKKFEIHPICAILGPRQVGKTTLAKMYIKEHFQDKVRFFDLENPLDLSMLDNPMLTLSNIEQPLIVIDEIQLRPDLFPVLRVLVDKDRNKQKFLILGSASRDLLKQSSETLAGRIGYIELPPFTLSEVKNSKKLWLQGGFPLSYLARNEDQSIEWRQDYIATFLERDIPNLGFNVPPVQMRRFWLMLTHYHGQTFNSAEICRSLGITDHMVRKYLDILAGTFMIRILLPWFENIEKRQVKSPKIYFRDSGILNALLNIKDYSELQNNPRLGAFWEGFALEEVINILQPKSEECFFWGTHAHAELDLFIFRNGKRLGFEFKYADAPKTTKSMRIAIEDLKLDNLAIIYPGDQIFPMDTKITAYGLDTIESGEFIKAFL